MRNKDFFRKSFFLYFLLFLTGIAYYFLAYETVREHFLQVLSWFTFLFVAYFIVNKFFSISHFKYLLFAGLLFRILLLFSVPNLSDDVYRFIWDGRLAANGINPFSHLPSEIMQMPPVTGITNELFGQINSPNYYTIYPPVMQGIFWLTAKLFPENVFGAIVFMKCVILLVDASVAFLLMQLLKKLSMPKHLSLLYFLNPLVITELTGNVHFEGLMIFFILLAFLLLLKNKWQTSALCLALGIATKLLPVLFIALIFTKLYWKKAIWYSLITATTTVILFAMVFDLETVQHMLTSINLFISRFEFNASVYYLIRYFGLLLQGYNIIAFAGPFLLMLSAVCILFISFKEKNVSWQNFFNKALLIIATWFLFSTTVHPWYICLPLVLSVFTLYRFAIIWSFTATLSYAAYQTNPAKENLWLVAAGYIFMMAFAVWETWGKKTSA